MSTEHFETHFLCPLQSTIFGIKWINPLVGIGALPPRLFLGMKNMIMQLAKMFYQSYNSSWTKKEEKKHKQTTKKC